MSNVDSEDVKPKGKDEPQEIEIQNLGSTVNTQPNSQRDSSIEVSPQKNENKPSGVFQITAEELEELMTKYKERGSDCQDLKLIQQYGGTDSILQKLHTDAENGISSTEYRENDFGSNKVFVEPVPPFCAYVWEALEDLMIRILIIAAIVQIVLGATLSDDPEKDWIDGLSIIIAVLVVVCVGSITNWQKENKFHELNDLQNEGTRYSVIRNKQPNDMAGDDLLVGDIMKITVGDIIPADLMLINGNNLKMDESALTGESDTMRKESYEKCQEELKTKGKAASPLILSGTNCVEGSGIGVVIAVGDHSQKGIIRRTVDNAQEDSKTPLEQKLDVIAENIGWFGMGAGVVTLVALIIRFGINYSNDNKAFKKSTSYQDILSAYLQNIDESDTLYTSLKAEASIKLTNPKKNISNEILDIILLCVSIIVVAIPEGLPLAVTLSLAFSIKKLMDQNNLVRKMHACETMGGANYICTDKTGTLTKNEMNIFKVLASGKEITLKETIDDAHAGAIKKESNDIANQKMRENPKTYFSCDNYWNILKMAIALNIDGTIKVLEKANEYGDTEECETKNKTDKAFIDFLFRFKAPISHERETYIASSHCVKQNPFDSKRKRMTTFIQSEKFPKGFRLFTKGGAENVKTICKSYLDPDTGNVNPMGDQQLNFISDKIEQFNKQMLRSLYICYKDITQDEYDNHNKTNSNGLGLDQTDLVFIAVVGIRDSLRNGVKEAVLKCKEASVRVVMVTGDNIITATAIARDCNILEDVNLENMKPEDIEDEVELTNNPAKRESHIQHVLSTKPKAITGNTFFAAIGGLICKTCQEDSVACKCPKTQAEADQIAKRTGQEIKKIKYDTIKDKERFIELTKNLRVMARSQPIHKYALVLGLRELDSVVAVTGDGTNDAPALSKSDVGFAMFVGTDIAKEASDIVIMDNNFSSIVVAIIYGRNIYDNIRKFLQFQLTVNFCACLLVFICACIGNETPLTPIQMLWVNLIMDSLGSLALATEPPYEALLHRPPTKRDESIINGKMWKHIGFQAVIELGILLFLYLYAPHFIKEQNVIRLAENRIIKQCYSQLPGNIDNDQLIIFGTTTKWSSDVRLRHGISEDECGSYADRQDLSVAFKTYTDANGSTTHMTIVFNVFVVYTLFNQINARVLDDSLNIFVRITSNLFFPLVTLLELILQVIIIEFGNAPFKVIEGGLTGEQWGISIGFSAITFVLSIIIKFIPVDRPIQNLLDNLNKDNKIANIDDLQQSKDANTQGATNKTDANVSVKKDNEPQERVERKAKKEPSIINPRSIKKGSSLSVTQGSLRQKKADVKIDNDASG